LKDFTTNPTRLLALLTGGVTVASPRLSFFPFILLQRFFYAAFRWCQEEYFLHQLSVADCPIGVQASDLLPAIY
jgi:hypothetical protein